MIITVVLAFATLTLALTSATAASAAEPTFKNATVLTNKNNANESVLFAPIQSGTTTVVTTAKNGTTTLFTTNSTEITKTETGTIVVEPPSR